MSSLKKVGLEGPSQSCWPVQLRGAYQARVETSIRCLSDDRSGHDGGTGEDAHVKDHTGADEVHALRVHEAGGQEVKATISQ